MAKEKPVPEMSDAEKIKAFDALQKAGKVSKPVTNEATVEFATIETGHNKQLRVRRSVYKGKENLGIQSFWREDESQDWQFGKAVTFDYEVIDDIITGLNAMKEWCEEHPNG